ncbi:MAG: hypothetical protein PVH89_08600, partial [Gammaproteobacteria bacterium]
MKITHFAGLVAIAVLAGCDGNGVTRPPPTDVAFFNAAANIETIGFYREESLEAQLAYAQGEISRFDSGSYDFNVDYTLAGEQSPPRGLTFERTLAGDRNYTFVVVAPGSNFNVIVAETDDRPAGADLVRSTMMHAFPGLGPLDVYVEPPDAILSSATPRASIAYEESATFEFTAGAYRMTLTTAGDPNDVRFQSLALTQVAGADQTFVVSDPGGQGTLDIVVSRIGSTSLRLGEEGETAGLRVINAIEDRLDRDIYLDDTTAAPFLGSLPFAEVPAYQDISFASHSLIVTPVGNPGAEESTANFFGGPG